MKHFIRATACAFLVSVAHADEPTPLTDKDLSGLIAYSTLRIEDDVTGNCWTNASTVKSKIHLLMEQNGIYVPDYEVSGLNHRTASTRLRVAGTRFSEVQCLVTASFDVITRGRVDFGDWRGPQFTATPIITVYENGRTFTNSRNVNEQLEDFAIGAASEFLAQHISAKRSDAVEAFNEAYKVPEKPLSLKEWHEQNENN